MSEVTNAWYVCRHRKNYQFLWIAFETWEHTVDFHGAYKFFSVAQIVDFFNWQGRDLSKYVILRCEATLIVEEAE